ncbi:MAG: bifunctional phosphopantothenoylcysteine decarboxylase/phosphopantothenate--cysteine ligase CoaBC [Hominisplanchenecus sp.]|nr:bifunctional phosphopantothenoylcysteine decarboxylase/phosphopantothenate--cysteine ligase CoaBC [Lachnospiraceae bacterium]MDY2819750.1 bifunctional phosphopantothenoylcysteine decarboxylase/phosphopantothenate--cysteine ligase CoaBC [Hominisplanchenecus sp.]
MLKGKMVILGVTGSIAAYKMANVASMLKKLHCDVQVIMTRNATNFITPVTFETLTGNKCLIDTFDRNFQYNVEHVALAKRADLLMIAPASANVIGKLAHGIADDMLTTTALACRCPKIVAPAMNTSMYENPIVQDNRKTLQRYGFEIVEAENGHLACGDSGAGKLPEEKLLVAHILRAIARDKDLAGRKVLITAGATMEPIDPVRYITNHSTGKMGFALARACMLRGADVTVVKGHTEAEVPDFVEILPVGSATEMFEAVKSRFAESDIVIMAAAVADYRPSQFSEEKVKKSEEAMAIPLSRTQDILQYLGEHKREDQFLCGFSMETQHMLENSRKKMVKKNLDMIVANNLKTKGAGFGTDTNVITILTKEKEQAFDIMSKDAAADCILDEILAESTKKREVPVYEGI